MIFSRKSAATRELHQWMACHRALEVKDQSSGDDWLPWHASLPAIIAAGPDIQCKFKGLRPLAWCMTTLPSSFGLLEAILNAPAHGPGGMDPAESIQDVLDASCIKMHDQHIAHALSLVLAWSENLPRPEAKDNRTLMHRVVRLNPKVDHLVLEKLRLGGYDPNAPNYRGYTVLHAAVANIANPQALAWALAHCNLEAVDRENRTALAIAAGMGAGNAASILMDHGADPRHPSVQFVMETLGASSAAQSNSFVAIRTIVEARSSAQTLQDGTVPAPDHKPPTPRF